MSQALWWSAAGTEFTFLMTALGASMVFLFNRAMSARVQKAFLGFRGGRYDRGFGLEPSDSLGLG